MGTRIQAQVGEECVSVEFDTDLEHASREERLASCGRALLKMMREMADELGISRQPGFNFGQFVDSAPLDECARRAIAAARGSAQTASARNAPPAVDVGGSAVLNTPMTNRAMRRAKKYGHVIRPGRGRGGFIQRVRREGD